MQDRTPLRTWLLVIGGTLLTVTARGEPEDAGASIEAIRAKHRLPALAGAAVRHGELAVIGVAGVRKFGAETAVTQNDKWHIGSCTKSMTASLAALMVEEKKIAWDTTVAEVFPELSGKMKPGWRGVTLEQLLTHRGGAPADPPAELWRTAFQRVGKPIEQRLAFVTGLLSRDLEAEPGRKFIYSNQGYAIAGAMLERVTRTPWEELMRKRLFDPLGMTSAGYGAPGTPGQTDQPWGHTPKGASFTAEAPGPVADNPPAIGPAGTVHCSIGDFARYAGWHARGARAGRKLLGDDSFTRLHRAVGGGDYAMGWSVLQRKWAGGTTLTHAGSNTLWYAVMWVAPEKEIALVAATNTAGEAAQRACDDAVAALLQHVLK